MAQNGIREYDTKQLLATYWKDYFSDSIKFNYKGYLVQTKTKSNTLHRKVSFQIICLQRLWKSYNKLTPRIIAFVKASSGRILTTAEGNELQRLPGPPYAIQNRRLRPENLKRSNTKSTKNPGPESASLLSTLKT